MWEQGRDGYGRDDGDAATTPLLVNQGEGIESGCAHGDVSLMTGSRCRAGFVRLGSPSAHATGWSRSLRLDHECE